jgi:predicted nucleotidyltransferase
MMAVMGIAKTVFMDTHVLLAVRERLQDAYGDRLEAATLFGSRARGDHSDESDYDIAVFLKGYDLTMPEVLRLADISWDIQTELNAVISFKPFPAGRDEFSSGLLQEVRKDGIVFVR